MLCVRKLVFTLCVFFVGITVAFNAEAAHKHAHKSSQQAATEPATTPSKPQAQDPAANTTTSSAESTATAANTTNTTNPAQVQDVVTISDTAPKPPQLVPSPPSDIDAKGYLLMDADSGRVIAEKNADEHLLPASLTKLMTFYVIFEAVKNGQIHLDDKVRISKAAWQTAGSRMFLQEGNDVLVKDLIDGIVVSSGNDACVAMSEYMGGTVGSFVTLMNQNAQALGMKNTHFLDSNGLPHPEHYSSPRDMAILARALIKHFPEYYPLFKQKWIVFSDIRQPNRNRLLWRDESVDGLKTGHTAEAGFCLVASAKRANMRLIAVVMGSESESGRENSTEGLLNYGFRFFKTYKLYSANTTITNPRVYLGEYKTVPLGVEHDLYVTVPNIKNQKLKAQLNVSNTLQTPLVKGKSYGTVNVLLDDKLIATIPLVALQNNGQAGFFARLADRMAMTMQHWFGHSSTSEQGVGS